MKEIKIGRTNDNDIVIDDNSVSRNHAIIFVSENSTMIQDNNSTNGTFINGRRIKGSSPLQTNDILKVGNMPVPWRNYVGGNPSSNANQSTRVTPNQNQYNAPVGGNGNQANQQNYPTKKKSSAGLVIVISVVAVVLFAGVFLLMKNNSNSSSSEQQDREVLKTQLVEQERTAPLFYLSIEGGQLQKKDVQIRKKGLFRVAKYREDGNIISCTIINSATIAKYKDVVLKVTFYAKTQAEISSDEYPIHDFFAPGSSTPWQQHVYAPKESTGYFIEITSAVAAVVNE